MLMMRIEMVVVVVLKPSLFLVWIKWLESVICCNNDETIELIRGREIEV